MTPLWREQAVHAIDVALAEAIYSLAVLPALIQRQTDVPASPTKLLGGADQFNRRWAEQYTAAATSLFGDSDQFSGFLCLPERLEHPHQVALNARMDELSAGATGRRRGAINHGHGVSSVSHE